MLALYRASAYKLIELFVLSAVCAVLAFLLYPKLCVLVGCGPLEAFGGMMLGYAFYSLVTGYLIISGAAFHVTRLMPAWLQGLTMLVFSSGYVALAMNMGLANASGFSWLGPACVGISACLATILARRMTPAFTASIFGGG